MLLNLFLLCLLLMLRLLLLPLGASQVGGNFGLLLVKDKAAVGFTMKFTGNCSFQYLDTTWTGAELCCEIFFVKRLVL